MAVNECVDNADVYQEGASCNAGDDGRGAMQ